jgi:coenzyme F420-reducing hydrogenase beta subunit
MDNESAVWNKLKGLDPYRMPIRHNFWCGKWYASAYRPIVVIARSPEEARETAIVHLDAVEKYLRSLRIRKGSTTIRAIKKSEKYRLKPKDVNTAKKIYGDGCTKAFNYDGELIMYEYDN